MNTQTTVPTLRQRQALAAYNDARREAIHCAERSARSLHRAAMATPTPMAFPSMQPAKVELETSDSPLPAMLAWAVAGILGWVLAAIVGVKMIEAIKAVIG